jgi:iron complex transport system substrate-binding protein
MGIEGKDERKAWERFKSLQAVKEKKVYILDSDKVCSPTPITFVKTLHEIYEMINGKKVN